MDNELEVGAEEAANFNVKLQELKRMVQEKYSLEDVERIEQFLIENKTFDFPTFESGLYSAALIEEHNEYTGYQNAWVRDAIHIANARMETGHKDEATKALSTLNSYFQMHKDRFINIINGNANLTNPMERPNIRFNGETLEENEEKWSHAQNDALGYFLWCYSKSCLNGDIEPSAEDLEQLSYFPMYFDKVQYWQDEDSGHWEEERKIEASSIGTALQGLRSYKEFLQSRAQDEVRNEIGVINIELIDQLIEKGEAALNEILPHESRQPGKERRYDSALLFLIYPLGAIKGEVADQILSDAQNNLQGKYGIKRYLGDSFWCADYKGKMDESIRTADFSDDMSGRDALLKEGEEAQWCIFDPIISIIYANKFKETGDSQYLQKQIEYFNRSVNQVTTKEELPGRLLCPELYYLEDEKYMPNDVVPLLWTQANLSLAFKAMKESLAEE